MLNAPNFFVCNNLQLSRQFANVCKGWVFMPFHRMKSVLFYFISTSLMIRPRMVLELGTFSGYSALSMAEGIEEESELHTFEIFVEQEDFIRKWFDGSKYADKLHLISVVSDIRYQF